MIKIFLCAAALGWVAFGSVASAATITVGYTYSVANAEFGTVTAPSFAAVSDADGYTLSLISGGNPFSFSLASGAVLDFGVLGITGVTMFTVTDIDPNLALDPNNASAFPIVVSVENVSGTAIFSSSPITITTPAPVPLPASLPLLGMAVIAFGGLSVRRRRQQQA
nr:hypothetical protein [uncultured Roseovarius sp.]